LPVRNRKRFEDIPESARRKFEFSWAERVEDGLAVALTESPKRGRRRAVPREATVQRDSAARWQH
jgi:hypothetical protein